MARSMAESDFDEPSLPRAVGRDKMAALETLPVC